VRWHPLSKDGDYPCKHHAPILKEVIAYSLDGKKCSPGWPAIIDSGSDLTLVPPAVAVHLEANVGKLKREGFKLDGQSHSGPAFYLQISHPDFGLLAPIEAAIMDRKTILFGRDCLRQILFTFHGPDNRFIIQQPNLGWWARRTAWLFSKQASR
jgi:hypothetical protein